MAKGQARWRIPAQHAHYQGHHSHRFLVVDNGGESLQGACDCGASKDFPRKPAKVFPKREDGPIAPNDWAAYWAIAEKTAKGREDQEDVAQECFLALWEARPQQKALAHVIAWRQAADYWTWANLRRQRNHPLSMPLAEGLTWADVLPDDAQERAPEVKGLLAMIPGRIVAIGLKAIYGQALTSGERMALMRYRHKAQAA